MSGAGCRARNVLGAEGGWEPRRASAWARCSGMVLDHEEKKNVAFDAPDPGEPSPGPRSHRRRPRRRNGPARVGHRALPSGSRRQLSTRHGCRLDIQRRLPRGPVRSRRDGGSLAPRAALRRPAPRPRPGPQYSGVPADGRSPLHATPYTSPSPRTSGRDRVVPHATSRRHHRPGLGVAESSDLERLACICCYWQRRCPLPLVDCTR